MTSILHLRNVSKKIGDRYLLKNINLKIDTPGIYGIIGRNGSGKSLLFKAISGLLIPSEGTIEVFNKSVGKGNFPNSFGALLDTGGFLPQYSGFRNLKLLCSIQNRINDEEIREVIRFVGLNPEDKIGVHKYSLGMKQRLGIAQAIMEKPKLLILDEPMNGLDETGVKDIRKMILDYKKNDVTIILTSHNAEDITLLCDKVFKMDNGELYSVK